MKVTIKNLGPVKSAKFDIGDFTVITGHNNTGKTYISYAVYGFLKTWSNNTKNLDLDKVTKELFNNGIVIINLLDYKPIVIENFKLLTKKYSENINSIFSANENEFKDTVFSVEFDQKKISFSKQIKSEISAKGKTIIKIFKDKKSKKLEFKLISNEKSKLPSKPLISEILSEVINNAILQNVLPDPYIITSERTGINIFQNELDINKNVFFEKLIQSEKGKFDLNPFEYLKDVFDRYSTPIKDGIDRTRDIEKEFKQNSFISKEFPKIVKKLENTTGVGYRNIKGQYFITYKEGRKKIALPIYLGSSSSRALFDLFLFIKHSSKKGQLLIIDEPELNLHPEMQIHIARLFASLSNIGIKIMITTHSDYIVKEINNLLMLNNEFPEKESFLRKYKYSNLENLKSVNFYIAEKNTLNSVAIDKYGLVRSTFDNAIEKMYEISDFLSERID